MSIAGNVLLGLGVAFLFLAALGTVRLPDAFARMHAGSKATTLGLACTFSGVMVRTETFHIELLLALLIQLTAAPLATHALGRAAHRAGVPVSSRTVVDELDRPDGVARDGPTDEGERSES